MKSRSSVVASLLVAALLLTAAAGLTACGGTKTSPGGPSGTGAVEGADALVVAQDGRNVVFGALEGAGIKGDPAYVYMNYTSAAKDEILVQGSLKNKDGGALGSVTVKNEGGAWKVTSVK